LVEVHEEEEEEVKEEEWETIDYSFIALEGMEDPFKDKWRSIELKY
jgi:hypothetical protein